MKTLETIEILGFNRINLVNELTKTVGGFGYITQLNFNANGVKAVGKVVFQMEDTNQFDKLISCVKSITGLVKVVRLSNSEIS
ncbi:MAG: hypothetical protein V4585_18760 [Bacteroidota bacterium]|jgi:hypothetical protein